MKTVKMAKCNKYKYSFCTHKHDAPECKNCILVHRRPKKHITRDGKQYVYCPRCNQYKPKNEFRPNSKGYLSYCIDCRYNYSQDHYKANKQSFMIGYRNNNGIRKFIKVDSASKMIKLVKQHMIDNNEVILEIKRL